MNGFDDPGEVQVPDVAEPLRGFRAWSASGFVLSGSMGAEWLPGEPLEASCNAGRPSCQCGYCSMFSSVYAQFSPPVLPHVCPSPTAEGHGGYGCGIYGYATVEQLAAYGPRAVELPDGQSHLSGLSALFGSGSTPSVWGEVELWGRVMVHEGGYRAEFARIVRLFDLSAVARRAAVVYGVPCDPFPLGVDEIDAERQRAAEKQWGGQVLTTPGAWMGTYTSSPSPKIVPLQNGGYSGLITYKPGDLAALTLTTAAADDDADDVPDHDSTVVDRWQQSQRDKAPVRDKFRLMFGGS